MKRLIELKYAVIFTIIFSGIMSSTSCTPKHAEQGKRPDYVMVIHGGAGTITRTNMTPEVEESYRTSLMEALIAGEKVLKDGGSSTDAVIASIILLEDNPLFNAGKGAVYNEAGEIAHDAAIMEGFEGKAGAVGMVNTIKHPILAANAVMNDGKHVFLVGDGAESFAEKSGLEIVSPEYFFTQKQWDKFENSLKTKPEPAFPVQSKSGTVGAVALDRKGNLAAGTSTGGMHFKSVGRIGDSPVIGAGTYADNKSCAVSATGHGEFFIRNVVAYDIAARMLYAGKSLKDASEDVVMVKLASLDAGGGIIAVDKDGNIAMPFNTAGMYRGFVKAGEQAVVKIYADE
jgi:beta-aspartyl-peptidase (threonine type)